MIQINIMGHWDHRKVWNSIKEILYKSLVVHPIFILVDESGPLDENEQSRSPIGDNLRSPLIRGDPGPQRKTSQVSKIQKNNARIIEAQE
jgi:hypothetical protein